MDIGAHLIGSLGLSTPKRHADIAVILAEAGEFPVEEVATFQRMVAFRNRIVHLYNRIDVEASGTSCITTSTTCRAFSMRCWSLSTAIRRRTNHKRLPAWRHTLAS